MAALTIEYDDRLWTLDLERIDVDDMELIEDYTGQPGSSWAERLAPTDRAGNPITADRIEGMLGSDGKVKALDELTDEQKGRLRALEAEARYSPPVKVVRVAYWVMLRQDGQNPGPIAAAKPRYTDFLGALVVALAKSRGVDVKAAPAEETDPFLEFDPKDKESSPGESSSESVTPTVPASP